MIINRRIERIQVQVKELFLLILDELQTEMLQLANWLQTWLKLQWTKRRTTHNVIEARHYNQGDNQSVKIAQMLRTHHNPTAKNNNYYHNNNNMYSTNGWHDRPPSLLFQHCLCTAIDKSFDLSWLCWCLLHLSDLFYDQQVISHHSLHLLQTTCPLNFNCSHATSFFNYARSNATHRRTAASQCLWFTSQHLTCSTFSSVLS